MPTNNRSQETLGNSTPQDAPSWVSELPYFCNDILITQFPEKTVIDFRIGAKEDYTSWRDLTTKSSITHTEHGITSCCLRLPVTDDKNPDPKDIVDTNTLSGFVFRPVREREGTIPHIQWPPTAKQGDTRPITDIIKLLHSYDYTKR